MTKKADVSVITASYNLLSAGRKQKMLRCLESVHEQTGCSIEHIIIDGASTDGTLEFLKPYEDKGWVKIYSEADSGIYDAFNKGIKKATGEYVCFINSDDYFSRNDGLSDAIRLLRKTNADFSYSPVHYEKGGKIISSDEETIDFRDVFYHMTCNHQGMVFKRNLFEKFGYHDQTYTICADYDFILRAILKGAQFVKLPQQYAVFSMEGYTGTHMEIIASEQIGILMKNYGCSQAEAQKIQAISYIPWKEYIKLLSLSKIESKYKYILRNWRHSPFRKKLREIRHSFIKLRTRKGNSVLRILGITLIDEENK